MDIVPNCLLQTMLGYIITLQFRRCNEFLFVEEVGIGFTPIIILLVLLLGVVLVARLISLFHENPLIIIQFLY